MEERRIKTRQCKKMEVGHHKKAEGEGLRVWPVKIEIESALRNKTMNDVSK